MPVILSFWSCCLILFLAYFFLGKQTFRFPNRHTRLREGYWKKSNIQIIIGNNKALYGSTKHKIKMLWPSSEIHYFLISKGLEIIDVFIKTNQNLQNSANAYFLRFFLSFKELKIESSYTLVSWNCKKFIHILIKIDKMHKEFFNEDKPLWKVYTNGWVGY